ncbi:MAG: DEAD/DEAH box helicase [Coriobacteriia bacterium]|nr:DEAD/DEAH box helicase [Coriobacteriia bacterium]
MPQQEIIAIFTAEGFYLDSAPCLSAAPTPVADNKPFYSEALLKRFQEAPDVALYELGFSPPNPGFSPGLAFLYDISAAHVRSLASDSDIELTRTSRDATDEELYQLLQRTPYVTGIEYISFAWLKGIWARLQVVFEEQLSRSKQTVEDYLRSKNEAIELVGRVFFHLVEHKSASFPFAFLATYSTGQADKVNHVPLRQALKEYEGDYDRLLALLSTVNRAAERSKMIEGLSQSGELFSPLGFSADEAYTFLREVKDYEECGIVCRIPDWWRQQSAPKVRLTVGKGVPSTLGIDTLLDFDAGAYYGDIKLSRDEIEALLGESEGLSMIKNRWVEINHEKLRQVLAALDKIESRGELSFAEALRVQMGLGTSAFADDESEIEVDSGAWLASLRARLTGQRQLKTVKPGRGFKAQLRAYQEYGLNWLSAMHDIGFGALLADDMGLGKTIQVLAYLERQRTLSKGSARALIVVPASLIHNWEHESARFSPQLRTRVIHTGNKEFAPNEADLFITTYGIVARTPALADTSWDTLIIDEAQAIKNPGARQTKAVKALDARFRIALTGTPIENRLSDLWSLSDFLNQGMLGTPKEFSDFEGRLQDNRAGYARLRDMMSPFILRRLKTDTRVISDLPEKLETTQFTTLTKKQVVLYKALVDELERSLQLVDGITRRGLVLANLMRLKQICNHPDHYTGQKEYKPTESGKFLQLAELCETIRAKHEKLVVFTQFKEMCDPLARYLSELFGTQGLTLHGSVPVKQRGKLVEQFNTDERVPFMVLSLKAGGTGLNLTAANHVVHFDRWWNPAVENQATDRVFRIGQKRDVVVHKFVTTGTIEEKIDELLTSKKELADAVIAQSGEGWITEMDNSDLLNLFRLDAVS